MTSDIIRKLATELKSGIRSELQVVYLLAGIRKIIERDGIRDKYWTLNFHCDWALHSEMDRAAAQRVLGLFEEADVLLRTNVELDDLPKPLRTEIDQISKMRVFRRELFQFLAAYDLPQLGEDSPFGWTRFLYCYARVIEDVPLVAKATDLKYISGVTVQVETAKENVVHHGIEEFLFQVVWTINDLNGESGQIFVINSHVVDA